MYFVSLFVLLLHHCISRKHKKAIKKETSSNTALVKKNLISASANSVINNRSTNSTTTKFSNIAICLTGQLNRLELGSKVDNLFAPLLTSGHEVFVLAIFDGSLPKNSFTAF